MGKRASLYLDSYGHNAPIPVAARKGPFIATGNISGYDFGRGCYPDSAEDQARQMFAHLRAALEAAGASFDDILKMTVYIRDDTFRPALNQAWLEAFPAPEDRPARQTILHRDLPAERMMACDVLAVASE